MIHIVLVKQRIRRGPAIEGSIEDFIEAAFRRIPGVSFETYELGENIREVEDRMRGAPPAMYQQARMAETEKCLEYIRNNEIRDVLLLNGYLVHHFNPGFFATLRQCTDTIAVWELDDPYYIDLALPFIGYVDVIFTVDTSTLPLYRRYEKTAEWLPLACEPAVHKRLPEVAEKFQSDVCFIGVPFKGSNRVRVIDAVAAELSAINARIIGATQHDTWVGALANHRLIAGKTLDVFVPMEDAVRYYNGAAINLNLHKDSYGHMWDRNSHRIVAQSPCERMFSIAGCGAFQLIDSSRPDLARLFDVGKDIIEFSDVADLSDKISYFLGHDMERRKIADSLQGLVLREHTYLHRVQRIVDVAFSGSSFR
jgi:spore maturation protein CgeB